MEVCAHCGTELDAGSADYLPMLFNQPTVRTRRTERITSDEEERSREGYSITTHYQFSPDENFTTRSVVAGEKTLIELRYAPRADVWRINHGWLRSGEGIRNGFTIDPDTGQWKKKESDEDDLSPDAPMRGKLLSGIRPCVTDTRNILLLRVPQAKDDQALISLAYALQRGIQLVYQIEEQEIAVERIGEGDQQRLLLWEAAEGGTGVWERIVADPGSFVTIAREALRVCHFDPDSGEQDAHWKDECAVACYDCLLSYRNQPDHPRINRHLIRDLLLQLTRSQVEAGPQQENRHDRYRRLLRMVDPASPLERQFLFFLYEHGLNLPDTAQNRPSADLGVRPDFYFERHGRPGICVFVDGSVYAGEGQAQRDRQVRAELEDRGFRVIAITGSDFAGQLRHYPDVFGALPDEPVAPSGPQPSGIELLLARGESETLEFKSSLRLGVPSGTVEPVVEKSILKTVAAFLNSHKGGTLIIGVEDNKNILGVEYDFPALGKKQDLDGYELHLRNLLNRDFGSDSAPLIEILLHPIGEKHVCEVRVKPGRHDYMLVEADKNGQKSSQLYIRTGNQTKALSIDEALRYATDRWKSP